MTRGNVSPADEAAIEPAEDGRQALHDLFDRLRAHVRRTGADAIPQGPEERRRAVRDLRSLSAELKGWERALETRLDRADDGWSLTLASLQRDVAAGVRRLESEIAQSEAQLDAALAGFQGRVGRWEAASADGERRFAETAAQDLERAEGRRARQFAEFVRTVDQTPVVDLGERPRSVPEGEAARGPRRRSRSAALLLSAGVACVGLSTLAIVLEPPMSLPVEALRGADVLGDLVLRGPILIAPPIEVAEAALPAPPRSAEPSAEAPAGLAGAIADVEAGRRGGLEQVRRLAEAGQPRAQMYLAKLYETGRGGLEANSAEARRWTARAAERGDPIAQHNLALYLLEGRGGPRDEAMAARLFRRAAVAGVGDSQVNLGLLYETGAGVDRSLVEAYKWFQIAAQNGDLRARARAVALEERLSRRELAAADRVVGRFAAGGEPPRETVLVPGAATVAESQQKLARLGFYIGPTDGRETESYREAVEAYRRSQAPEIARVSVAGP